jgi:hypothetical protein
MVLSGRKAISQGFSVSWNTSAVTVRAMAACGAMSPDAAIPAVIINDVSVLENFILSPSYVKGAH